VVVAVGVQDQTQVVVVQVVQVVVVKCAFTVGKYRKI
jgi:hypothetical protein